MRSKVLLAAFALLVTQCALFFRCSNNSSHSSSFRLLFASAFHFSTPLCPRSRNSNSFIQPFVVATFTPTSSLLRRHALRQPGGDIEEPIQEEEETQEDMARAASKQTAGQTRGGKKGRGGSRSKKPTGGAKTKTTTASRSKKAMPKGVLQQAADKEKTTTAGRSKKTAPKGSLQAAEGKPSRRYGGWDTGTTTRSRKGKTAEELVPDVEIMAKKAGVQLPKEGGKKKQEVKEAIEKTSDKPYREYYRQGAVANLKKTHKVTKATGKGDPFAESGRRSPRQKRGVNAPPSPEEKKKPPSQRHKKSGEPSERSKVAHAANRKLADALYELADYVLHADATQKGLSYQKAAKSIRTASKPIKTKEAAQKLPGIGKSVGDKIEQFIKTGHITVLDEYKSGKRGT